ncbi:MAG: sulfatase-like hydrolase/transferase, partial [Planctomycetes bacterium]|nr:sulfatase-like hydrolase/transferase [Planctomycetota bacterium]
MKRPNVLLVLTDDQGYGDLGSTGNPWIRTPNLDAFAVASVRCNDFHVSPLCTPTRGSLMTAHNPLRNGAWATCWGRSILRREETTIADHFAGAGYRTGLFGKWHLGDSYPYRPQDRGFQKVVAHKGGGVGNTPDFWGNSYFDDTYFANGKPTRYEGYCTDVWFEEATAFITEALDAGSPFFACVTT